MTECFGLVAQLGERTVRIREVESSNLFRSTINRVQNVSGGKPDFVGLFLLLKMLGEVEV